MTSFSAAPWRAALASPVASTRVGSSQPRLVCASTPTIAERTLLVGEAAGLVNPLTGEGIDYALESGAIAAEHLLNTFEMGDFSSAHLAEYGARLHHRFDKIFRFSEWTRDWYCKPSL